MYKQLKKIFHQDESLAKEAYKTRFNSEYSCHINLQINGYEVFFVQTPDIFKKLLSIESQDKKTIKFIHELPDVAIEQIIKQYIIDEITSTNDIEGVYSSRKEITKILEDTPADDSSIRFLGLIKHYWFLFNGSQKKFVSCEDIRNTYDQILLDDIVAVDENNMPDGKLFRKGAVSVTNNGKSIHEGLLPEEKIIEFLNVSLDFLNDNKVHLLLRTAAFHYLFGYIHPFYDGNGRLNRFISSAMLSSEYESIVGFCLSATIKESLSSYYKAFNDCNHILNKADITSFIEYFVNTIYDTYKRLNKNLSEKISMYNIYLERMQKLKYADGDKFFVIYDLLLQASLFSELGISTKDLLKYTNTTRTTLRKRLNLILKNGNIQINKLGNEKFYSFNNLSLIE